MSILCTQTVANNNNVALCSLNLRAYADAVAFATNVSQHYVTSTFLQYLRHRDSFSQVIVLIGHLEMNIPDGQVWKYLVENGVTEDKLRKLWKKKAYYYLGKAEMKRKNYKEAIKALQSALALIADDAALTAQSDELRDLINVSKSGHAAENKKQKQTWTKAFEKRSKEPDAPADTPAATSSSSATPTKAVPFGPNNIKVDLGTKKTAGKGQGSSALSTWTWHSPFLYGLACVAALGTFSLVWYRSRR
jgi:tetratricopeptide (TPR) repeat protein